ncbi:MAG TPA: ATP-binding protein [Gammaproteobacteria bacterium]
MIQSSAFRLDDRSNVAEVRRAVRQHAARLGWGDTPRADAEIVATELATNLVKHARDGVIAITSHPDGRNGVLVLVSVDRGPGMSDVEQCLRDGFSTQGSPGTGLGAVRRLARSVDVLSDPSGTVVMAELEHRSGVADADAEPLPFRFAALSVAKEGEPVSGDGWACRTHRRGLAVLVCDGLGHGVEAGTVTARAIDRFRSGGWDTPKEALAGIDAALKSSRGAAAAVALVDPGAGSVTYCGIGNIAGGIFGAGRDRRLVSMNGILGGTSQRMTEFEYEWREGAVLLVHSDGVSARWQARRWPALWSRHPGVIAGVVYRDCARGTDDAVIVAVTGK